MNPRDLEEGQATGDLVDMRDVMAASGACLQLIKAELVAFPALVAPRLAGLNDAHRTAALELEVANLLDRIADGLAALVEHAQAMSTQ